MSYVLTVIHPPAAPAAFGEAVVPEQDPFTSVGSAVKMVIWALSALPVDDPNMATVGEAREIGRGLIDAPGREIKHPGTGLAFRIDPADNAPHPCPCCGRLVLPEDHADAAMEDAYCLGCFTWSRDKVQCLPANTAHTEEPT